MLTKTTPDSFSSFQAKSFDPNSAYLTWFYITSQKSLLQPSWVSYCQFPSSKQLTPKEFGSSSHISSPTKSIQSMFVALCIFQSTSAGIINPSNNHERQVDIIFLTSNMRNLF